MNALNCLLTIEARGCQRRMAQRIIVVHADYLPGLKGNQREVQASFERQVAFDSYTGYTMTTVGWKSALIRSLPTGNG